MKRIVSMALLAGGIVLIVLGINATNSLSSDVSKLFLGSPTDKAVSILVAGILAAIIGLTATLYNSKQT